jgi:hypothetical protein
LNYIYFLRENQFCQFLTSFFAICGYYYKRIKGNNMVGHLWLTPRILATQEARIRKIMVQSLHGQTVTRKGGQSGSSGERLPTKNRPPSSSPVTAKRKKNSLEENKI